MDLWEPFLQLLGALQDFYPEYIKCPSHLNGKEKPNFKMGKRLEDPLSKKIYGWMANKHMKRCSALLVIRKMQIKTKMNQNHNYEDS